MYDFYNPKCHVALTMPHPRADLFQQMPHPWERKVRKCPTNAPGVGGGVSGLGIDGVKLYYIYGWSSQFITFSVKMYFIYGRVSYCIER